MHCSSPSVLTFFRALSLGSASSRFIRFSTLSLDFSASSFIKSSQRGAFLSPGTSFNESSPSSANSE
ncbi:hypothetical protein Sjap_004906 [Stephania japonica]|uniref:Uncharacterized protein n=1 Tax=Stephania japonica TaxID=461633 RepID=A0AAP0K342_9MAGN